MFTIPVLVVNQPSLGAEGDDGAFVQNPVGDDPLTTRRNSIPAIVTVGGLSITTVLVRNARNRYSQFDRLNGCLGPRLREASDKKSFTGEPSS
jgi:hypothetical protein